MLKQDEREVILRIERPDGQQFIIGTGTDWRMENSALPDWNTLDYAVNTSENVLTDGSSVVSKRVNEKDRTLTAVYMGKDQAAARQEAITFFNPKFQFKVHITYHGRTMWCMGEQVGFTCSTANIYQPPTIKWMLLCPDPYMKDEFNNNYSFGDTTAGIGFPYISHNPLDLNRPRDYPAGFAAGVLIYDGKNSIYNGGDVPCYYKVQIKAKGSLVNPTIKKDDKMVKLLTTLSDGDIALIDFESSPPKVTINGANAIQKCSRDSNFTGMIMQVGKNIFSFEIDNMVNRSLADVKVLYNNRYLGI